MLKIKKLPQIPLSTQKSLVLLKKVLTLETLDEAMDKEASSGRALRAMDPLTRPRNPLDRIFCASILFKT